MIKLGREQFLVIKIRALATSKDQQNQKDKKEQLDQSKYSIWILLL